MNTFYEHHKDGIRFGYRCFDRILLNGLIQPFQQPVKKLRGKQIVRRIGHTRRYEPLPTGLRAVTALLVLRNKAIKPLLAAAGPLHPARGTHNPKPIDADYHTIQAAMAGVFHELGLAA